MARPKRSGGDTTVTKDAAVTTHSAVDKGSQIVSSHKLKKIDLSAALVCDPGSVESDDMFVDNIMDTDDYEDL